MRHFTHLSELAPGELLRLAEAAIALKKTSPTGRPLSGKSVAFCFMNPSLRTQTSCEAAAASLGAHPITLGVGTGTWQMEHLEGAVMNGAAAEHIKEAAPVLSRYCAAIGLRSFPSGKSWEEDRTEPYLTAFRRYATAPVINLESATGHPCQALGDLITIRERMNPQGKNFLLAWAPHVKALPMAVPISSVEMAAAAGMKITIARPEGYDLPPEVMKRIQSMTAVRVMDRAPEAYDGAHVVYAKSWGALSRYGQAPRSDAAFRAHWLPDAEKMRRADKSAIFLHCLPVRRNLEVSDEVLDGPWSAVIDEAENRLHAAKAVLLALLAPDQLPQK